MKIVGILPVRNEDWVLGLSARAALMWCDAVMVLDHRSHDNTTRILCDVLGEVGSQRLIFWHRIDEHWFEMEHRHFLLEAARAADATHVAIVDADEVLTGNLLPHIRKWIEAAPMGEIMQLPWVCLRGGIERYHASGIWSHQDVSMAFRDEPRCHWSAEGRAGYDFHQRAPMGRAEIPYRPIRGVARGGLMHLQFVNETRLRWKQLLYCLTERIRWPNRKPVAQMVKEYSLAVYGDGDNHMAECPAEWWKPYEHLMQYFRPETPAWQEAECRRIVAERPELMQGLDRFGLQI